MKLVLSISFLVVLMCAQAQVEGVVVDSKGIGIPDVKLKNQSCGSLARSSEDGSFTIAGKEEDVLVFTMFSFDTLMHVITKKDLSKPVRISLSEAYQDVEGANVIRKHMEGFDVGVLATCSWGSDLHRDKCGNRIVKTKRCEVNSKSTRDLCESAWSQYLGE